jgi:hypothetical protein
MPILPLEKTEVAMSMTNGARPAMGTAAAMGLLPMAPRVPPKGAVVPEVPPTPSETTPMQPAAAARSAYVPRRPV